VHASQLNSKYTTVIDVFHSIVNQFPNREAVVSQPSSSSMEVSKAWTYGEFNDLANRIARKLLNAGVAKGSIIGILLEPSVEMIAAIFAIWKIGGVYLPLSQELPKERIEYLLNDSRAKFIITHTMMAMVSALDVDCYSILLDGGSQSDEGSDVAYIFGTQLLPSDAAYIIYTSGSTGLPKGVLIKHSSLMNSMCGFNIEYPMQQNESFLVKTSLTFDASFIEYLWPLLHGCKIVVIDNASIKNPDAILHAIFHHKITRAFFVSSSLSVFLTYAQHNKINALNSLRYIFVGGEVLHPGTVEHFRDLGLKAELINCYGPTETTIAATIYPVSAWNGIGQIPIGKAMHNVQIFVVNEDSLTVSPGEWGELYIAGDGVAEGYLNRPELTEERFITTSYTVNKVYRTGDIVRQLFDGNLEYQGRMDGQVKIRGYRIEVGEIEAMLHSIPGIISSAVVVHLSSDQTQYLCAYYSAKSQLENEFILNYLAARLPSYMIPSHIVYMNEMPIMFSGKINRAALSFLSQIENKQEKIIHSNEKFASDIQRLIEIWSDVLDVNMACIGTSDDFYSLGGNSLRMIEMATRVHNTFSVDFSFDVFLEHRTIAGLATYLTNMLPTSHRKIVRAARHMHYPLTSAQMRMYLLYLKENQSSIRYNVTGMIKLVGNLDVVRLELSLNSLCKRHASFRTSIKTAENGMPVQIIDENINLELTHLICNNHEELRCRFIEYKSSFDLDKAPLIKFELIKLAANENEHILLFDADHIIFDGVSIKILIDDLLKLYHGYSIDSLEIDYIDYAIHEKSQTYLDEMNEKKLFWKEYLKDFSPAKIACDHYQREDHRVQTDIFDKVACERIDKLCKQLQVSRFAFILSAFILSIYNESQQNDLTIASAFSNRNSALLNGIIGNFVNIFLVRNTLSMSERWSEFAKRVMDNLGQAIKNGDFPYEVLSENLKDLVKNSFDHQISVLINHFSYDTNQLIKNDMRSSDLKIYFHDTDIPIAKYDMSLYIFDTPDEIKLTMSYITPLYSSGRMKKLLDNLIYIVQKISEGEDVNLSEINKNIPIVQHHTKNNEIDDFEFEDFGDFS